MSAPEEVDDVKTAIEVPKEQLHRAAQIRIKQKYNCGEEEITQMRSPFLGFSVFVRFQCRARVHPVKIIKTEDIEKLLTENPNLVPYSSIQ